MSARKYLLLLILSVIIAALIFIEILCENQVASLNASNSDYDARILQAERQTAMRRQLIQRMAYESQQDSALAELLAKHGVKLSKSPRGTTPDMPAIPGGSPSSVPGINPAPVPFPMAPR